MLPLNSKRNYKTVNVKMKKLIMLFSVLLATNVSAQYSDAYTGDTIYDGATSYTSGSVYDGGTIYDGATSYTGGSVYSDGYSIGSSYYSDTGSYVSGRDIYENEGYSVTGGYDAGDYMIREGAQSGAISRSKTISGGEAVTDYVEEVVEETITVNETVTIPGKPRTVVTQPAPVVAAPKALGALPPFRISIDGKPLDGDPRNYSEKCCDDVAIDKALHDTHIQLAFDGLELSPSLNVTSYPEVVIAKEGVVEFVPSWNYGAWIQKAEVRVFDADDSSYQDPIAVLPFEPARKGVKWQIPGNVLKNVVSSTNKAFRDEVIQNELQYVLRVYSKNNRFDQTHPKRLTIRQNHTEEPGDNPTPIEERLGGWGDNNLAIQNIVLTGGTATVNGEQVPPGHRVFVQGNEAPVDPDGRFVAQELLPVGENQVIIAVVDTRNNKGIEYQRTVEVKDTEWFYVGLGDLTYGINDFSGPSFIQAANPNEFDDDYLNARLAMYLKGKVKGEYLITAMADTGEGDIEEIFKNIDEKDPRYLFRRLDPDRYYPVYGDDSTLTEDAATQGKFYVRVEKDNSYALWGNYQTAITDTDLAHIDRALYGAKALVRSNAATSYGESMTKVKAFGAEPGTVYKRENFRGTGGSVYYFEHQDITQGSERLRVEVRDAVSQQVIQTRNLVYGEDYDVDFIQGRVILTQPLPSTADDSALVAVSSNHYGNPVYLVAQYEITPINLDVDGYIAGGRAQQWIGDHVRLGLTGMKEDNGNGIQDSQLLGGDVTLRYKPGTYIKGEYVESDGGFGSERNSLDGGFSYSNNAVTNTGKSSGYRGEASIDFKEVGIAENGRISAYYEDREGGFATPGKLTADDVRQYGGELNLPVGSSTDVVASYDVTDYAGVVNHTKRERAAVDVRQRIGDRITVGVGAAYEDDSNTGDLWDVGGELRYKGDDWDVYGFGQDTVSNNSGRDRNARYGVGGNFALTDKLSLGGEVQIDDDSEIGGRLSADYRHSDRTNYYLAYDLVDRTNTGTGALSGLDNRGSLTFGGRTRYSDALSVFGEEHLWHGGTSIEGLTHSYGVNLKPDDRWTFGANIETGEVENLDRTAIALNGGYTNNTTFDIGVAAEYRDEENENIANSDRETYVGRVTSTYKLNDELKLQGKVNALFSDGNQANVSNGEFVEGSIGLAYRPIDNDRLNALAKYVFFHDLATTPQINSGTAPAYKQRSHIGSIDVMYDINQWLTLGAKYGFKLGQVAAPNTNNWIDSTMHLGVLRADFHVVHAWDILAEIRGLYHSESDSMRFGALAAIYRHIGNNVKVGVGYNFSDFSDDLTNVDYDNSGPFVNLITKF